MANHSNIMRDVLSFNSTFTFTRDVELFCLQHYVNICLCYELMLHLTLLNTQRNVKNNGSLLSV